MRILVVEESRGAQSLLEAALEEAGHSVDVADDGETGLQFAEAQNYAMIILDVVLPKLDGLSLLREIRSRGQDVHMMFLTAQSTIAERVQSLNAGGDDYMVKPFSLDELLARVEAVARRIAIAPGHVVSVGDLYINLRTRHVRCSGQPVELTAREYRLLECLALRKSAVVSVAELEAETVDDKAELASNAVASAICVLRKKLHARSESARIQTCGRMGYMLEQLPPSGRESVATWSNSIPHSRVRQQNSLQWAP